MSYISDNIIPGKMGKTFTIGIKSTEDLDRVLERIMELDGVKDVCYNADIYPHEITVHTHKPIGIKEVQAVVKIIGFHAVAKTLF